MGVCLKVRVKGRKETGAVACQRLPGSGRPELSLNRTSRKCQVAHTGRPTGRPVGLSSQKVGEFGAARATPRV